MSETSAIVLPDAAPLDGTEHIAISQSGNLRRVALSNFIFILPTADPHVNGALWNNLGTITISSG